MLKLLDTTLRDGSYIVDFQFTTDDTTNIVKKLDESNVHYIELGHGLGLGASRNAKLKAACTDEDYMQAAVSASIQKSKWGMFFIPGIGTLEDIELAAKYGIDFIRIGTNVTEIDTAESFIYKAKEHGMYVFSNLMKTYAVTPDEIGKLSRKIEKFGADVICIVDSAGGMFPEDVEQYCKSIQNCSDLLIGFHGHNNLGLAIANTLRAVEHGASVVDTSMRGLGRSAGNAATEILLYALLRQKIDLGIDPLSIMDIAEEMIDPIIRNHQLMDSLSIVSGFAQFHSSFLDTIKEFSNKYEVDPRELIVYVSQIDRINAPAPLVEEIASQLQKKKSIPQSILIPNISKQSYYNDIQTKAETVAQEIKALAKRNGKLPVFNITQSFRFPNENMVSSVIQEGDKYVYGSSEISSPEIAEKILTAIEKHINVIFLDVDIKIDTSVAIIQAVEETKSRFNVLTYSDIDVWAKTVIQLISEKVVPLKPISVLMLGKNVLAERIVSSLRLRGVKVYTDLPLPDKSEVDVVVCTESQNRFSFFEILAENCFVVDAMIGSLPTDLKNYCNDNGILIYRPDMRISIHAEIDAAYGMRTLVSETQGIYMIDQDFSIAAGGVVAPRGTVIVDDISSPSKVFGIADGEGFLLPLSEVSADHKTRLESVKNYFSLKN